MALLSPIGRRSRSWGALLLAFSVLIAGAQEPTAALKIKAVYLVKFIQFVDWPDSAFPATDSPLVIGVLGADPFGHVLDEVAEGEIVKNHHVIVRRYRNLKAIDGPQVLFIGASETSRLHSILPALKYRNILTVSDMDGFSSNGGVVHFLIENNKVHFRINVDAARKANLQISSKLLQLAEIVHDQDR
jgi:hypothetical protein